MENWKPVVGISGYLVSDQGRVKSINPRKGSRAKVNDGIMNGWIQNVRYDYFRRKISFRVDKKTITKFMHHVVLEAFCGHRPPGMECLHKNGNALDNRAENLRWGTHLENHKDSVKHGTAKNPPVHRGENNPCATISDKDVRAIRDMIFIRGTAAKLARQYGVSHNTISRIKSGKSR